MRIGRASQFIRRPRSSGMPLPLGLADNRSDLVAAFSLRRVRMRYAGPLVRIRRSSDNVEQDFGTGQTRVSWAEVLVFIGAGSGFVTVWYDQSGNGRNFLQATAASQPQLIDMALLLDGVDDNMKTAAFTLNQPWSFMFVFRQVTSTKPNFENFIDGLNADTGTLYRTVPTPDVGLYAGLTGPNSGASLVMPVGTRGAVSGRFAGPSSRLEVDAALIAGFSGSAGLNNPGGLTLGTKGDLATARFSNIEAQELLVFNTAHTSVSMMADNAAGRIAWG